MNYEALGRYTLEKEAADSALKERNRHLFALKRWAESSSNNEHATDLDNTIGARLIDQALRANDVFNAAVDTANAFADLAQRPKILVRTSYFKE